MNEPKLKLLNRTDPEGRPLFQLLRRYRYRLGPGTVVEVPAGYVTNFGTIPRFLWWWISPGELREGAIVHDYMCNEAFNDDDGPIYSGYSRWMADAVLYEAMARLGFGWFKRATVFAAVRVHAILFVKTHWPARPEELKYDEKLGDDCDGPGSHDDVSGVR